MGDPARDEPSKIEGDPEDPRRGVTGLRWYVVVADTGEQELPPNPPGGFATEDEAHELHQTLLHGDPRLEVRPVHTP